MEQLSGFIKLQIYFAIFTLSLSNDCLEQTLFSSKTPYKFIENLNLTIERPGKNCKAIQLNMVHRHGNRYPSIKDVRKMNAMQEKINQAVDTISSSIDLTLPWKNPFTAKQDKILSTIGEKELYEIGKRLRARFPELFMESYSPLHYSFQSTCKLRCTHSANALSVGLFENTGSLGDCHSQPVAIKTYPCNNDAKLRFFDICEKYIKDVLHNKSAMQELKQFDKGKEVNSVLEKVKSKLGLPNLKLTIKDLKPMFVSCAYEIGMFNGSFSTGICSLFDKDDLHVMEYTYDLKHFYKRSAGYKINYEISCPLLRDIVDTLKAAVNDSENAYMGVFRSSHAETILPLYALVDIFLDTEKLTAENYEEMKNRKFRAACISPFSGQLYFVLYKCDGEKYKIQLYANERLVRIPCCSSAIDCDFDVFIKCYNVKVEKCNLEQLCKLPKQEL